LIRPGPAVVTFGLGLLVTHGFGLSLMPALLPEISADLGAGYDELGAALASGMLFYSIGAISAGRLLERLPNRGLLVATFAIPALGLVVANRATSGLHIALAVIILGVNAGVSWPATLHLLSEKVEETRRTMVMSAVAGGVGLGLIVNGTLVQQIDAGFSWRAAVLVAAAVCALPIVATLFTVRGAIDRPEREDAAIGGLRAAARTKAGWVVGLAGLAAGLFGAPFVAFLSAVAVDELGASSNEAALLWWLVGGAGIIWSLAIGRLGQRTNPVLALVVGSAIQACAYVVLASVWAFWAQALAAALFVAYYYPMWGLAGSFAASLFSRAMAVRAVVMGLLGAAVGGALANTAAGVWFDSTGTFRPIMTTMAIGMGLMLAFFAYSLRLWNAEQAVPDLSA